MERVVIMKETKTIRELCKIFGVKEEDLLKTIERMKREINE